MKKLKSEIVCIPAIVSDHSEPWEPICQTGISPRTPKWVKLALILTIYYLVLSSKSPFKNHTLKRWNKTYTLIYTKYLISDWMIKWQLCLVSSPKQLCLVFHLTGQHRDQCWTDWKSLPSHCILQMRRPAHTPGPRDSASAPSAALYHHLPAGFPGSTEGPAPPACSRERERKITGELMSN